MTRALANNPRSNIESFRRPIRFASNKKCGNCRIDFSDFERLWRYANRHIGAGISQ